MKKRSWIHNGKEDDLAELLEEHNSFSLDISSLTNKYSESLENYMGDFEIIRISKAYCTSRHCCYEEKKKLAKNVNKVVKAVSDQERDCPDCLSSLMWKTKFERRESNESKSN